MEGFEWLQPGCLAESRLSFIGLRDIDLEEGRMLRDSNVNVYTMRDVDKHGIARCIEVRLGILEICRLGICRRYLARCKRGAFAPAT